MSLEDLKAGKAEALEQVVAEHQEAIIAYLYCLSGGDLALAKDLCQETFLVLIKKCPKHLSSKESLRPWLFQVAKHKLYDLSRKKKLDLEKVDVTSELSPDSKLMLTQDQMEIQKCLADLPEDLRQTVELRVYEDMKFREISEKMDVPLGTVLWRMKRALGMLKNMVKIYE